MSSDGGGFSFFVANLRTELGPAMDFSEKVTMLNSMEPKMNPSQFEDFLELLGSKKSHGVLDPNTLEKLSVPEMKSLITGMTRSGDLSAIDAALCQRGKTDEDLLGFTVRKLMRSHPGKSIEYFDEIADRKIRKYCLTIAIESVRAAGADLEADEWLLKLEGN